MAERLTAVVIGASGIGKHHAKWLNHLGCEVAGFVGTTPASVKATGAMLAADLDLAARGYTDVEAMLAEVEPQVVNICSPPAFHYRHFMSAAARGCHIMCEKPLTWDEDKSLEQLLGEAGEMAGAGSQDTVGAVNTQYAAAPAAYFALCEEIGIEAGPPETFFMQMDSRNTNKTYERVWVDLASHPLSILRGFCGPGEIVVGSEKVAIKEKEVLAQFTYQPAEGAVCEAEILVRAWCTEKLVRRFGINGLIADYAGRNDEKGVFRTYLTLNGHEGESDDFMYVSLSRFVAAVRGQAPGPLADLAEGYGNQAMQLALLNSGRRE